MDLSAVVLLVLAGFVLGVLLGLHAGRPAPSPALPDEPPPPVEAPPADARWRASALALAEGLAPDGEPPSPVLVATLARAQADGYALGVSDLREAVIASSGLSPQLIDEAVTVALSSLEARRA